MSTVRLFELAREFGVDTQVLIQRVSAIGIVAKDHLTALDSLQAKQIRDLLTNSPAGGSTEKKVNRAGTVVRRRRKKEAPAPPPPVAPIAAAPTSAVPTVVEAPAPITAPSVVAEVPAAVAQAPAPEPVAETAATPAPAGDAPAGDAPVVVAASAGPASSAAPVAEVVAPSADAVAAAEAAAAAVGADGKTPTVLPDAPSAPTLNQAVVVIGKPSQAVLDRVKQTRMTKGYDESAGGNERGPATGPARRDAPGPGGPAAPPRPGVGVGDRERKPRTGKRVVMDRRREHLVRRGLIEHDDIFRGGGRGKKKPRKSKRSASMASQVPMKEAKRVVKMGSGITIGELAQGMMIKATQVIGKLMQLGEMATVNQTIDFDTASTLAEEFGWRVESVAFELQDYLQEVEEDDVDMRPRPPVVTVMGHVDHGKTSLLDCIRDSRVADGEAGGITQHIGASTVTVPGKGEVVFIDTPGHEAFTAMRARGSQATDIVILVVAADDGVMPQTKESIAHAKAANVPVIVAVNKIDKANANPDRVLSELSENGLVAEAWGGETQVCHVSALKNIGIDKLLEMLLLQAELLELKANVVKPARGIVLEGRLERGRGPVATVLVQEGVLEIGDTIVSGMESGRVRAMTDDRGKRLKKAGPSTPVEVLGLSGVPDASSIFYQVKDDKAASKIIDHRNEQSRMSTQAKQRRVSLESLSEMLAAGEVAELNIIVKADVHGSAEAVKDALEKLSHPDVGVKVIHAAVGGINESDVNLASASDAIIVGFNVRPEAKAKRLAEQENVDVKLYSVIYDALDDVKAAMAGLLSPIEEERSLGSAEVRMTISVPRAGTIAGSFVTEGNINRGAMVRLIRDNVQIFRGNITSLRRFKNDVREVAAGYECGIGIGYNDIKEGDVIEAYEIVEIAAKLEYADA